jgi:diacylglycerol kinase family enzyme
MPSARDSGTIALILNKGAGAGSGAELGERLGLLFRGAGREVRLTIAGTGAEIAAAVKAALGANAAVVVAGGGDGTVSAVAAALVGHDTPLGVVALGTLNHFARDLRIPLDPEAAAQVILAGHTAAIDLGQVNGRTFLNNASLGLYPQIVRARQRHPATGFRKWIIAAWITLKVLARHRAMAIRLNLGDAVVLRRTPIVFVGNNEYRAAGLAAGSRDSLSDGTLAIYIVNAGGRRHPLRLLRLAWHMVVGTALDGDHLELVRTTAATVEAKQTMLHMALDGEVELFVAPLEFRILPAALTVVVPLQEPRR